MRPNRLPSKTVVRAVGAVALLASVVLLVRAVDAATVGATFRAAAADPAGVLVAAGAFAAAFCLRAAVWTRVLPRLRFGHALAAIHVSLLGNHVLPFRLGEALRVTSVVRRARVPLGEAAASTVVLRGADVLAVAALAALLAPAFAADLTGRWGTLALVAGGTVWLVGTLWLRRLAARRRLDLRLPPAAIVAGAVAGWLLESVVIWQAARYAGIDLTAAQAVMVTSVTIAAQVVAVAPGGIGTYEAAATAAFVAVGANVEAALAAAVAAHALKTAYSFVAGAVAVVAPTPTFFGRVRLPRAASEAADVRGAPPEGPVVLFMPAHDEEAAVARVARRVPDGALGRRVVCIVVDDGSSDATREEAARAGAVVVAHDEQRGLGAAVRTGLAAAVESGAAAVAFCDADGEYAPEELERLLGPILAGDADYVVGSRFAGDRRRMRPHRLLGNVVLTRLLSFAARRPISDGQSGYRALSRRAAEDAEIIHDFNYAQVLTLDLLAKGFRYAEVPISYRFRTEGRSFVRLGRYLRHVFPAVHRELNADASRA